VRVFLKKVFFFPHSASKIPYFFQAITEKLECVAKFEEKVKKIEEFVNNLQRFYYNLHYIIFTYNSAANFLFSTALTPA